MYQSALEHNSLSKGRIAIYILLQNINKSTIPTLNKYICDNLIEQISGSLSVGKYLEYAGKLKGTAWQLPSESKLSLFHT